MFSLEINYQVKAPLSLGALFKKLGRQTLALLKIRRPLSVSVALVGPTTMKKINYRYRGKNKTTDVLSFEEINEIIIDYCQAVKQAKQCRHSAKQELSILFTHGLLHVLGYEDATEKGAKKMAKLVRAIIDS